MIECDVQFTKEGIPFWYARKLACSYLFIVSHAINEFLCPRCSAHSIDLSEISNVAELFDASRRRANLSSSTVSYTDIYAAPDFSLTEIRQVSRARDVLLFANCRSRSVVDSCASDVHHKTRARENWTILWASSR